MPHHGRKLLNSLDLNPRTVPKELQPRDLFAGGDPAGRLETLYVRERDKYNKGSGQVKNNLAEKDNAPNTLFQGV